MCWNNAFRIIFNCFRNYSKCSNEWWWLLNWWLGGNFCMMLYKVPFDFTHEEKVFGGYLSLRQMLYIILIAISVGILFLHISMVVKMIIFIAVLSLFLIFAFLKIGNLYADRYFLNILKFVFRKKIYIK